MRASVSDILLFRKCPQAWVHSRKWSSIASPAMARGTHIHAQIASLLEHGKCDDTSVLMHAGDIIHGLRSRYNIIAVEHPFQFDLRGHTILTRPDAILYDTETRHMISFQIKTSSRNMARHSEYVRISPHEAAYYKAIEANYDKVPSKIIMLRYIQTNATNPKVTVDIQDITYPSFDVMDATITSLVKTLDDMERALQSTFIVRHGERCIDWNSGSQCGYFHACHNNTPLDMICVPAVDRYADIAEPYTEVKHNTLFPHPGDINVVGGIDDI